jgi:hypothetical protein
MCLSLLSNLSILLASYAVMVLSCLVDGVLLVLGDDKDKDFPIYHTADASATGDADTGYTLTTALFSVQFGDQEQHSSVTLYLSNPKTSKGVHITKPIWIE